MTDTPEPVAAPTFTSYREMVDWIADRLRDGSMWGSWADGRFTFGDTVVDTDPDTDGVRIDGADEYEVGVMAASIASKMVALSTLPSAPPVDGRNRAQRRADPDNNGARRPGLWTPGR
jgi:hypothetical protein